MVLAFARLAEQASNIRDVTAQALGGLGASIALTVALLAVRATATSDILKEVRGLRDFWWVPLAPFATSAGLFLYASAIKSRIDLPDPMKTAWYIQRDNVEQALLHLLATLVQTYDTQSQVARTQAFFAQLGVAVLGLAMIVSLLTFLGVR